MYSGYTPAAYIVGFIQMMLASRHHPSARVRPYVGRISSDSRICGRGRLRSWLLGWGITFHPKAAPRALPRSPHPTPKLALISPPTRISRLRRLADAAGGGAAAQFGGGASTEAWYCLANAAKPFARRRYAMAGCCFCTAVGMRVGDACWSWSRSQHALTEVKVQCE